MDLGHDRDDRLRPCGVAQPPAGHGVGLGKAVDHDGPFGHAGQRREGNMAVQAVGQLGIDLVREDHHLGTAQHFRQLFKILLAHDGAGGVVGVGQDQQLGAGGDGRPQLCGCQAELILGPGGDGHGHAAGELGDRLIADKAGFRDDDLVPRLDQRADGQVDRFAAAHRDQGLFRLVLQFKAARQIAADLGPQFLEPGVGRVLGAALFQTADARVAHAPRRFEVRLPHAQGDTVGHIGRQVKKFSDAGRPHCLGGRRQQFVVVHHSIVHSLSSVSSAWYRRPPRL